MSRPIKCRRVEFIPVNQTFYPHLENREEVILTVEEIEAIRLSDLEGMEQDACADSMGISRGTFQRIINAARQKLADALVRGKIIRIEGGNYEISGHPGERQGRGRRFRHEQH
ncbi:RNA polymerase sigma factor, region 3/4 [Acididesulfobacillus acetoxydans]|uniref:UPF0251 protein DEACI_2120 n=1 Tax=Acididesulfobacillus acetoxydans TaxID=1561005 RepID=A0A8S0VX12_9FIRM|nr:DUF134 domain-containing protein [Acididesulfobacillus acetoxydans]CAA7601453.1 RNA polymerase sigma factor, region 3/4 [Acididesulfobacillus acetoxydans]CAA7603290.1 RNA polymerase sigma factor, region 3/4 [Acididesulfobacillus acetoxydans]